MFDVTEPQTFLNVKKWLSEISNHCDDVPRVLVGNKLDAPNRVVDQKGNFFLILLNLVKFHFRRGNLCQPAKY